jgi:hypothetical protein
MNPVGVDVSPNARGPHANFERNWQMGMWPNLLYRFEVCALIINNFQIQFLRRRLTCPTRKIRVSRRLLQNSWSQCALILASSLSVSLCARVPSFRGLAEINQCPRPRERGTLTGS